MRVTKRGRFAGDIIHDSDEAIAAALKDVSVPTLLVSLVHMTGDASILDGPLRPAGVFLNEYQGFMSEEDQESARAMALELICKYRDNGCDLPAPPTPETIQKMMNFLVGEEIPSEYVPMMLEELELDGVDRRKVERNPAADDAKRSEFSATIIGAGMSGILAGIRLSEAGIPFRIIEKNPGVGGTWFENRYPGARVDVGNHFYCYSFAPNNEWSQFFASQPELGKYFEDCARDFGIFEHIEFGSEVIGSKWNDTEGLWHTEVRRSDGSIESIDSNFLISATGQLNRPKLPDIEGIDSFAGLAMHSAQWEDSTDLRGKRVAVVGTGASAFQIVPTIAGEVEHLSVFQRSAQWMFPNPNYHEKVGDGFKWALKHLPFYGRWFRFLILWPGCDGGLPAMRIDPDFPDQHRAISEINDASREFFTGWITSQVEGDDDLLEKVVPDYVCLGKRTLQDNGSWLQSLTRDNVELVTDPIERVTESGITTDDGTERDFDIIIYATGFNANKYLWPMEIVGRDGTVLSEQWGDSPTANLGITMPNFPNLFCLYGPGTNLATGGSLIFHSECEIRYIMGCIEKLLTSKNGSIECTQEAHDRYNTRLQDELSQMIWSHPSIKHSWYQNDDGKIYILSPWRLVDFWAWTREPDLDEFEITTR